MSIRLKLLFFLIILLAFFLRFYGISWDLGRHLHPDERMIIMVSERISLKNLNPNFFAYGSFPIYLLKATGTLFKLDNYDGLLYIGRFLSVLFDMVTVILVYKISCLLLFKEKSHLPLLAAFLYAISVLPIQASHFYAVDIPLTTLSTFTLLRLLLFLKNPSIKNSLFVGLFLGLSLATKVTIGLLLAPVLFTLLLIYFQNKSFPKILALSFLIFIFSFLIFALAMPYALLDFAEFKKQIALQLTMNKNPYIFPYTLQYVGTLPYVYYLKNIILWGLGIPYGVVALISTLFVTFLVIKNVFLKKASGFYYQAFFIILVFFWVYFLVVGKTAVKFMRYLLPLYPLLAVFSAYTIYQLFKHVQSKSKFLLLNSYFLILLFLIWPFSFVRIYQKTHTRIKASNWINQNIPEGSSLGIEHWDDPLPLFGGQKYLIYEYPLYDQDNLSKWVLLSNKIAKTDYIILASNRLYVPLPKLTDCTKHKNYCYPDTANYYKQLFSGELGFKLAASFSAYPKIPFFNIEINDDSADESFTVYDHPKIYIFKNEEHYTENQLIKLITDKP